jgi:hypothetical protein
MHPPVATAQSLLLIRQSGNTAEAILELVPCRWRRDSEVAGGRLALDPSFLHKVHSSSLISLTLNYEQIFNMRRILM